MDGVTCEPDGPARNGKYRSNDHSFPVFSRCDADYMASERQKKSLDATAGLAESEIVCSGHQDDLLEVRSWNVLDVAAYVVDGDGEDCQGC